MMKRGENAMSKNRILVVEDDEKIGRLLELELKHEGYDVKWVQEGYDALIEIEEYQPDVVVLDIMLPDVDGIEIARRIRKRSEDIGIIMLTALGEKRHKLEGFESGADDYVVKPFDIEELIARIEAVMRRTRRKRIMEINVNDIRIFPESRRVFKKDKEIRLSKTEFDLLLYLARNANRVLSKDQILESVWGIDDFQNPNVVEVYINYLRKKLGDRGDIIKTVRGIGYMLRGEEK